MMHKLLVAFGFAVALASPAAAQVAGPVLPQLGVTPPGVTPRQFCAKTPDGKCWPFMTQDPNTGALALAPPTLSQVQAALGGDPLLKTGGTLSGPLTGPNLGATPTGGCDTSSWNAYAESTQSPVFSCPASKISTAINLPFPAVVGIGSGIAGDPAPPIGDTTYVQNAQALIQAKTALDGNHQEIGLAVNFIDSTGGSISSNHNQKVALNIFALGRPGGSNMWGINTDVHANSGFNKPIFGWEGDMTIFDQDRQAGSPAGNAFGSFMTFSGFMATAGIDMTGNPNSGAASLQYGLLFQNGGYSGSTVGQGLIRDASINDSSNSHDVIRLYGTHDQVINTTLTAGLARIWASNPGQFGCFYNGTDDCIGDQAAHVFRFTSNGGSPLQLVGSLNGYNGVSITSAGNGFGPTVTPFSIDGETNVPLNLQGKGSSPVQVLGGLSVIGNATVLSLAASGNVTVAQNLILNAATPASSSATCTSGTVGIDASYVYVCTATNTFKRVALTAF